MKVYSAFAALFENIVADFEKPRHRALAWDIANQGLQKLSLSSFVESGG